MPISKKLPLIIIALALLSALANSIIANVRFHNEMTLETQRKLGSILESRRLALSDYLESIKTDLLFQSRNPYVADALFEFGDSWTQMGDDASTQLQAAYIDDNPHPKGRKQNLDEATDGSLYSLRHSRYHPWFRLFQERRGYYDLFLVSSAGDVIYSVAKESDYGTNLIDGPYADSGLGRTFRRVRDVGNQFAQIFEDFSSYAPSGGAPAAFIGQAVFGAAGTLDGVLIFQMPEDRIDALLQADTGLGESGETYLVGSDKVMRSDSRFEEAEGLTTLLSASVDRRFVDDALAGATGIAQETGRAGGEAFIAYAPLPLIGTTWAIVAEVATDEILAPVAEARTFMIISAVVILFVTGGIGIYFARGISNPINAMTASMKAIADGQTEAEVPGLGRADEIGQMAEAVQVFKENSAQVQRMSEERAEQRRVVAEERRQAMDEMATGFESSVGHVVEAVSAAASQMQASAQSMTEITERATGQIRTVVSAADVASSNVATVATAAEELAASIDEIARQVTRSAEIADGAAHEATAAREIVGGLADAADRIGQVVSLINDIAEQTNLLALNATIEAARAGEAGKGFAVVANEVKNLATQTGKATGEISTQIDGIQVATKKAVDAMGEIGTTIDEVNSIATTIASSVEEQGAATREIARNTQEAARGTQEVSATITEVTQSATETGESAGQVLNAARELARQGETLRGEVAGFMVKIRTG